MLKKKEELPFLFNNGLNPEWERRHGWLLCKLPQYHVGVLFKLLSTRLTVPPLIHMHIENLRFDCTSDFFGTEY